MSTVTVEPARENASSMSAMKKLAKRTPLATVGVVLVIVFTLFALLAPWIAPQSPSEIRLEARLQSPSGAHCWRGARRFIRSGCWRPFPLRSFDP